MRSLVLLLVWPCLAVGGEAVKFRWVAGEVHTYDVEQTTRVEEEGPDRRVSVSSTRLLLRKSWSVQAVEADGTATLVLRIEAYRQEISRPSADGKSPPEQIIIDSATPDGAQAVADYLNQPILTVKIDGRGQMLEVIQALGDTARLKAELPFRVVLPETAIKPAQTWERSFQIVLDPPFGTGERHTAVQRYQCESIQDDRGVIRLTTELSEPPRQLAELQPLLPWLWQGTVTINLTRGSYEGAELSIEHAAVNHAEPGSRFSFKSDLRERRVEKRRP